MWILSYPAADNYTALKNVVHVLEYPNMHTRRMHHFPIYAYILQNPIYKVSVGKSGLMLLRVRSTSIQGHQNWQTKNTPLPLKKAWQFASTYTDVRLSKAWQAEIFSDIYSESPSSSSTTVLTRALCLSKSVGHLTGIERGKEWALYRAPAPEPHVPFIEQGPTACRFSTYYLSL